MKAIIPTKITPVTFTPSNASSMSEQDRIAHMQSFIQLAERFNIYIDENKHKNVWEFHIALDDQDNFLLGQTPAFACLIVYLLIHPELKIDVKFLPPIDLPTNKLENK